MSRKYLVQEYLSHILKFLQKLLVNVAMCLPIPLFFFPPLSHCLLAICLLAKSSKTNLMFRQRVFAGLKPTVAHTHQFKNFYKLTSKVFHKSLFGDFTTKYWRVDFLIYMKKSSCSAILNGNFYSIFFPFSQQKKLNTLSQVYVKATKNSFKTIFCSGLICHFKSIQVHHRNTLRK